MPVSTTVDVSMDDASAFVDGDFLLLGIPSFLH